MVCEHTNSDDNMVRFIRHKWNEVSVDHLEFVIVDGKDPSCFGSGVDQSHEIFFTLQVRWSVEWALW